ncbi:MAG: DUF4258 domain-containing protein [bacterium]
MSDVSQVEDSEFDEPLRFIQNCVRKRQLFWTYHVNMRMEGRHIQRRAILNAVETYEIIESYPDDKYLPSYLILSQCNDEFFHVLFATDVEGGNVRVVTAYRPDLKEWESDMRTRRRKK